MLGVVVIKYIDGKADSISAARRMGVDCWRWRGGEHHSQFQESVNQGWAKLRVFLWAGRAVKLVLFLPVFAPVPFSQQRGIPLERSCSIRSGFFSL